MPKPRAARLETPTARRKLEGRPKPYYTTVSPTIQLGYRRNAGAGTWSVRVTSPAEWVKKIALADDLEPADGRDVLTYWQAIDAARRLARREHGDDAADDSRPITVSEALDAYERDLMARGGDRYNASRARLHLTPALLSKPVALLGAKELKRWRDSLKGLAPATVNRTLACVCAALELAAAHDPRIQNRHAWEVGLGKLPDATEANNIILDDDMVLAFIAEAYRRHRKLGLLVETAAETGARPSQIVRIRIEDLDLSDQKAPRLRVPKSGKGGTRKRAARKLERIPVPISVGLAALLKQEATGRDGAALLLTRSNGESWGYCRNSQYREDIIEVVKVIGLGSEVTLYSLRHSSIVRALKLNVPIRLVAALHDTSVSQIEKHYSKFITHVSDDIARRALLQRPMTDNVVPLVKG